METRWTVTAWTFDDVKGWHPETIGMFARKSIARALYEVTDVTDDCPQVELYEWAIDECGNLGYGVLLERKD